MPLTLPRSPPLSSSHSQFTRPIPLLYEPLSSTPVNSPPSPTSKKRGPVSLFRLRSPRATTLLVSFACAVVFVSLCLLWVPEKGMRSLISAGAGERKAALVVKQEEEVEESPDISLETSPSLPVCPKTLLFRPRSARGFASEYLRFVRITAVADVWGYEVVVEDQKRREEGGEEGRRERWMYGAFSDYFTPPPATCVPPSTAPSYLDRLPIGPDPLLSASLPSGDEELGEQEDGIEADSAGLLASPEVEEGEEVEAEEEVEEGRDWLASPPKWTEEAHVRDGADNAYLSSLFLSLSLHPSLFPSLSSSRNASLPSNLAALRSLQQSEVLSYPPPLPLPSSSTVPLELQGAYEMQEEVVRKWWKLKPEEDAQVVALGEWVEGRKVIGVHLRLGDKCLESASPKYSPLRFANASQLASLGVTGRGSNCQASRDDEGEMTQEEGDVYGRAVARSLASLADSPTPRAREDGDVASLSTLVVVMSDSPTALLSLRSAWARSADPEVQDLVAREGATAVSSDDGAAEEEEEEEGEGRFEMVQLGDVAKEMELRFEVEGAEAEGLGEGDGETSGEEKIKDVERRRVRMVKRLRSGFSAAGFRDSPLPLRIAQTRSFIRDLTFLARYSSALVLTESSNVGRLLTLLAGRDLVNDGKVISTDVRWFPNAYYD
ncbi:hypothetical protein JCM11251_001082 [Rhodosporidiobolus azoricus]